MRAKCCLLINFADDARADAVGGTWHVVLPPTAADGGPSAVTALVGRVIDLSRPFGVGFERAGRAVRVYTAAGKR